MVVLEVLVVDTSDPRFDVTAAGINGQGAYLQVHPVVYDGVIWRHFPFFLALLIIGEDLHLYLGLKGFTHSLFKDDKSLFESRPQVTFHDILVLVCLRLCQLLSARHSGKCARFVLLFLHQVEDVFVEPGEVKALFELLFQLAKMTRPNTLVALGFADAVFEGIFANSLLLAVGTIGPGILAAPNVFERFLQIFHVIEHSLFGVSLIVEVDRGVDL